MLQQRSLRILETIMANPSITVKELEIELSLTRRQVDYGINRINDWLEQNKFEKIVKHEKGHVVFSENINRVLNILSNEKIEYIFNEHERLLIIYLYLYVTPENVSIYHLTSLLNVSRGTVSEDLRNLSLQLKDQGLTLSYSRVDGYQLKSDEEKIRERTLILIAQLISSHNSLYVLNLILEEVDFELFTKIKKVLKDELKNPLIKLSDNDRIEITYIASFILMRDILAKKQIKNKSINVSGEDELNELNLAKEIINKLGYDEKRYVDFILSLLLSYSMGVYDNKTAHQENLMYVIERISLELEVSFGIQFPDKVKVLKQIYAHFRPAYYRVYFEFPIINPLKEKIKKEYHVLFNILKGILKRLNSEVYKNISEDEIAYLTIHFATLIDMDMKKDFNEIKAAIVCPNGVGISLFLYKELNEIFPEVTFLKPISVRELEEITTKVDIVFSTKLIKTNKPLFVVNPIMSNLEKDNLINKFYKEVGATFLKENNYVDKILNVINKYTEIKDYENLKTELTDIIPGSSYIFMKRRPPMLSEIVTKELVQLNLKASDWQDAIRQSAISLLDNNKITSNYIEAMIESAEESGPYIVITKHVALPHARPEEGVKELAISISTLEKPIVFGNEENDPVKFVFCLCAIDNATHLTALSELVELLEDPTFYKVLNNAKESEEVIHFIEEYEKENDFI